MGQNNYKSNVQKHEDYLLKDYLQEYTATTTIVQKQDYTAIIQN